MTTDDKKITVQRRIDVPAEQVFDVLSNPNRHVELDGSGFVRGLVEGDRLETTGQVFTMDMTGDHMGGDYKTDNVVSGFDHNKLIAWKTAPAGQEPPGWEWLWELEPQGRDATDVTLTYDWSSVTDPEILKMVDFPLVDEEALDDSMSKLAQAVSG